MPGDDARMQCLSLVNRQSTKIDRNLQTLPVLKSAALLHGNVLVLNKSNSKQIS